MRREKTPLHEYHLFLDEAGDATFFEKRGNRVPTIGQTGVSHVFILGMVQFHDDLPTVRQTIAQKQAEVERSVYYRKVPSVVRRASKGGFFFHAKDDLPEIRKEFFDLILSLNCTFQAIVGNKDSEVFESRHNGKKREFYADLLARLIAGAMPEQPKLVLNIAELDNSTSLLNLNFAKELAKQRLAQQVGDVLFNVGKFKSDPLLAVPDYLGWGIQRLYELGETRFYEYSEPKISRVVELFNKKGGSEATLVFDHQNPLTEANKKESPQSS